MTGNRALPRVLRAVITISIASILVHPPNTAADFFSQADVHLTKRLEGLGAVSTSMGIYVFGGYVPEPGISNTIMRVTANETTIMTTELSPARSGISTIWNGTHAFLFGGDCRGAAVDPRCPLDVIDRYDPITDTMVRMNSTLPTPRRDTAAAWDGTHAYVFGGLSEGNISHDAILRYNPLLDELVTMNARLPTGRWGSAASYDGKDFYLFGGAIGDSQNSHVHLNEIVKYNASADNASLLEVTLPSPRHYHAAVSDGGQPPYDLSSSFNGTYIYLFGGHAGTGLTMNYTDEVVQYKPSANRIRIMGARLPHPTAWMAATWQAGHATILGGYANGPGWLDNVTHYSTYPLAPMNLSVVTGPGGGQISLSWSPPYNDTVIRYRVYNASISPFSLMTELESSVTSFIDSGLPNGYSKGYAISAVTEDYLFDTPYGLITGTTAIPPSKPLNLSASSTLGQPVISLAWQQPSSDGGIPTTGYRVYRWNAVESKTLRAEIGIELTYADDCTSGVTYSYEVRAVNGAGQSDPSNAVQQTCGV